MKNDDNNGSGTRLPTLRLITATHSDRCLETFYCSSAVSNWWAIATWPNGCHLQ